MRRTKADTSNQNKISRQNNNYQVYKGDSNTPVKDTNSKDISHKKYGIRTRHFQAPPIYSPQSIKETRIIVKREPNVISNSKNYNYQSKTSQNQANKNIRNNNNDGSISLFGGSQSNYVFVKNTNNKYQSNYKNQNKKYEQNLTTPGNKRNLDIKNQYKSSSNIFKGKNGDERIVYSKATNLQNNVSSISIIDIKKKSPKPYVLNERKLDLIQYKPKSRKKYDVDLNGSVDAKTIDSANNHAIYVNRNVTKEYKTIADLPANQKVHHRYNYNHNPNLSNTATHSIDATRKKPKKEIILTPRKNEIIISTKPLRKSAHISKLKNENKPFNFTNDSKYNKYKVTDVKYNKNYNQFDSSTNINKKNEPKTSKYNLNTDSKNRRYNANDSKNIRSNANDSKYPKYNAPESKYNKYNITAANNNKYNVTDSKNSRYNINDSKYSKNNENDTKYNKYNVNDSKSNRNKYDAQDNKNIIDKTNKINRNIANDYNRRSNDFIKNEPIKITDNKNKIDTNVYKRKKNNSEYSFTKGKKDEPFIESYKKPKIENIKESSNTNKFKISSQIEPQNDSKKGYYKRFKMNHNSDINDNNSFNNNENKKDVFKKDFSKLDNKDDKANNKEIANYKNKEKRQDNNNQDFTVTKVVKEKIVKINYNDDNDKDKEDKDNDKGIDNAIDNAIDNNDKDNNNFNQKAEKLMVKIEKEENKIDIENKESDNTKNKGEKNEKGNKSDNENAKDQNQKNKIEKKNVKKSEEENEAEEEYEEEEEESDREVDNKNKNSNTKFEKKVEIEKKVIKSKDDDKKQINKNEIKETNKEEINDDLKSKIKEKLNNLKQKIDDKNNPENGGLEQGIYQKKVIQREEIHEDNNQDKGQELQVGNDGGKNTKKVIQEIRIVKEKYINTDNEGKKGKDNLNLADSNSKSENIVISKIIKDNQLDNMVQSNDTNLISKSLNEKISNVKPGQHIQIEEIEEHVDYGDNENNQAENQQGKKKVVYREERHYIEGEGSDDYIHADTEGRKRETFGKEIDIDDNRGEDAKVVEKKYIKYEEYNEGDEKTDKKEKLLGDN